MKKQKAEKSEKPEKKPSRVHRISKFTLKVLIIVALVFAIAILLKDSSDRLRTMLYDAAAPTSEKFSKIQRWLPSDAELVVVADLHRFFSEPGSRARTSRRLEDIGEVWNVSPEVLSIIMDRAEKIGLVAAALSIDPHTGEAQGLFVVQGEFNESEFVEIVEEKLKAQGGALTHEEQHATTVYGESPGADGFAFAFPDRTHLLIGPKSAILGLVERDSAGEIREKETTQWGMVSTDGAIFGRLLVSPRVQKLLPEALAGISAAGFSSDTDLNINLVIPCVSLDQAEDLAMFIEGSRVSFLLTKGRDYQFYDLLRGIKVASVDTTVEVMIPAGKVF
jgi:hypothetical protein